MRPYCSAIVFHILIDVDKDLLAGENDVLQGRFSILYSALEAVLSSGEISRKLLVEPPLCNCLVAVAVDEPHCVFKW